MRKQNFYGNLAFYYDFICSDRKNDIEILKKLIKKHKKSKGKLLLDVACGTGLEDKYLKRSFKITGIDKNIGVLKIAKRRNPEIKYKIVGMKNFKLKERFDAITCFDAMPYLMNYKNLKMTLNNFCKHLVEGGVLIFYLDHLKEHQKPENIVTSKSKGNLNVTLFEKSYSHKNKIEVYFIFLIKNKKVKIKIDMHSGGIFSLKKIKKILSSLGFKTYLYSADEKTTFSLKKYSRKSIFPIFVCVK